MMSSFDLANCDHGPVARIKRNIMERDVYPRKWGMGPVAAEKKTLKGQGKLDKYGRPNENTPAAWNQKYIDYTNPEVDLKTALKTQVTEKTDKDDVLTAPPKAPDESIIDVDSKVNGDAMVVPEDSKSMAGTTAVNGASEEDEPKAKKVKTKHEGSKEERKRQRKEEKKAKETPEERAARKERKKAKREKKAAKAAAQEASSSE